MRSIQQELSIYSRALDLRASRHQVLASNVANADTPNYKARDFDFSVAMKAAEAARTKGGGSLRLELTAAGHLPGVGGEGETPLLYRQEYQSAVDGNTVEMDHERTQIADNSLQYLILTQLVSGKLQGMRTALSSTQG